MFLIHEPINRISKRAINVWRISNLMGHLIFLAILAGLIWAGYHFTWYHWMIVVLWVLSGLTFISGIWSVLMEPPLLYKYWRYGIDEEYVRLTQGVLTRKHHVIPMTKVQYVGAEQGPILRKYKLYTVTIGTMRSSHEIPALPEEEAFKLRNQIANHAKIKEVES